MNANESKAIEIMEALKRIVGTDELFMGIETEAKEAVIAILNTKRPRAGRPENTERNNQIKKDKESMSWTELARKHQLSYASLYRIINRGKGLIGGKSAEVAEPQV